MRLFFCIFLHVFSRDKGPEGALVPLEFLFTGAPSCDEQRLGEALRSRVEERLQERLSHETHGKDRNERLEEKEKQYKEYKEDFQKTYKRHI